MGRNYGTTICPDVGMGMMPEDTLLPCYECNGAGWLGFYPKVRCPKCLGTGIVFHGEQNRE